MQVTLATTGVPAAASSPGKDASNDSWFCDSLKCVGHFSVFYVVVTKAFAFVVFVFLS